MLQKYKEEKQLQKLKEQREKTKRGVFKVGLYRPDMPCFLFSNQNAMKAELKKVSILTWYREIVALTGISFKD